MVLFKNEIRLPYSSAQSPPIGNCLLKEKAQVSRRIYQSPGPWQCLALKEALRRTTCDWHPHKYGVPPSQAGACSYSLHLSGLPTCCSVLLTPLQPPWPTCYSPNSFMLSELTIPSALSTISRGRFPGTKGTVISSICSPIT